MGKGRMTLLDVRAIVTELRTALIGLRVANIYNLTARTFQFKFRAPEAEANKIFLIMESGVRVHTTKYEREKDDMPSSFVIKLRKHIRTRRLEDVRQLGTDRVIDFQFGTGDNCYHLILELYAAGNVILTDGAYTIMLALRTHDFSSSPAAQQLQSKKPYDAEAEKLKSKKQRVKERQALKKEREERDQAEQGSRIAVRQVYPFQAAVTESLSLDEAAVRAALSRGIASAKMHMAQYLTAKEQETADIAASQADAIVSAGTGNKKPKKGTNGSKKKLKPPGKPLLRNIFAQELSLGPELSLHCILSCGMGAKESLESLGWDGESDVLGAEADAAISTLVQGLQQVEIILNRLRDPSLASAAYLVGRVTEGAQSSITKKAAAAKAAKKAARVQQRRDAKAHEGTTVFADGNNEEEQRRKEEQKDEEEEEEEEAKEEREIYFEFLPTRLAQHEAGEYALPGCRFHEFPSFNGALDQFFSQIEAQKETARLDKERQAALDKVERVRDDNMSRIEALEQLGAESSEKALLLETNVETVDRVIDAVGSELRKGTNWKELEVVIREQKEQGNPVASVIHSMKLRDKKCTLLLYEGMPSIAEIEQRQQRRQERAEAANANANDFFASDSEHSDEESDSSNDDDKRNGPAPGQRVYKVEIDVTKNAYMNAEDYYGRRKVVAEKKGKTAKAAGRAIKAAEKKTEQALKQVDTKQRMQKLRKVHWFEKFHWFISSENFLVIGGKDAQQNEILFRRHLDRNDLYVHGDFHGAASVIIKNPSGAQVPPKTIFQACTMTVCRSKSWTSKVPNDAYWVHADQVSKTAPTGEYLTTGSFMVRGRRNYVPHTPLVMAVGVLFRLEESSIAAHKGERAVKDYFDAETADQQYADRSSLQQKVQQLQHKETQQPQQEKQKKPQKTKGKEDKQPASIMDALGGEGDSSEEEEEEEKKTDVGFVAPFSDSDSEEGESVTAQFVTSLSRQTSGASAYSSYSVADPAEELLQRLQQSSQAPSKTKKKVSKSERRRQKKLAALEEEGEDIEAYERRAKEAAAEREAAAARKEAEDMDMKQQQQQQQQQQKRKKGGKKNRKKMKKHEEQDDEDRALAAKLFGIQLPSTQQDDASGTPQDKMDEGADQAAADIKKEQEAAARACYHCHQMGHVFKDCPVRVEAAEKASFAQAKKAAKADEKKEIDDIMKEENIEAVPMDAGELDGFTGRPLATDHILYAIPVCAPLQAIADFKYKVKLVPGGQKRGKAVKQVLEMFTKQVGATDGERDLMRGIADNDWIGSVLSSVRVAGTKTQSTFGKKKQKNKKK